MRNTVTNVIELLIGGILIGLGLLYLSSQYKALSRLTEIISKDIIEDNKLYPQYSFTNTNQVTDGELYSAIMGPREYPIMVDENPIPANGHDYGLYFTYIKTGDYKKEYYYDESRNIIMVVYSYLNT